MKYELDLMDARDEGIKQGKAEGEIAGAIKAVTMLKRLGIQREKIISELTKSYGMSRDEALKLVQKS